MSPAQATPKKHHDPIGKTLSDILRIAVPIAISAGMVMWLFHKVDIHRVVAVIREGVDWRYIAVMMALTVLSHVIRGIRWGIQLRAAGIPRISPVAESVSIFGAYSLNLFFPFLGEAWRCIYISRRERCKLSTVVGTDIGDRLSDAIVIGLLIALAAFTARPYMERFLEKYPIGRWFDTIVTDGTIWIVAASLLAVTAALAYIFRHTKLVTGAITSLQRIWRGFSVLFHMRGIGMYLVFTLGIWMCYFLETYVCFFAFPFTRELVTHPGYVYGLIPGLVVFVFGSCSMGVPSNGGLGPWNIAVMFALSLFGISATDGTAFSLVFWSFQTAITLASGIFSAFYILATRRKTGHLTTAGLITDSGN